MREKQTRAGEFIRIIGGRDSEAMENHSVSFYHTQCTVCKVNPVNQLDNLVVNW